MKPAIVLLEPTNLLLLSCALIYGLIGEPAEAAILLAFVVGISLLDAIQQQRSNRALAELARLSAPLAHVRRAGVDLAIAAEQLRLGDLLRLEEGDRVAADASLTETVGLWLDESLLTGESLPVAKQGGDWIRAGSLVASGRGWAEVMALAEATELGQIGRSLATVTPPPTRLQRHTRRLTSRLTLLALGLCTLLAVGQGAIGGNWPEALLAALALALALLPNEIPVVLALFLALGALRLARIGVLARWPAAVESLGSATVLAVDKTGTLTENRMAVQRLITWPEQLSWQAGSALEEPFHQLLEMAVLASRGDPVDAMELAIQRLALDQLSGSEHLHPDWPLEREYPLQTNLLVFSQLWGDGQGNWQLAAKGAPEAIADLCHLDPQAAGQLMAAADQLAAEGLRVLAVASGIDGVVLHDGQPASLQPEPAADPHDYVFQPLGLIGLADPLRAEVPGAIATARGAGVRIVMVTGDSPVTARSIADQAGLPPGPVVSGHELEGLTAKALAALYPQVCVFARVMPQQKLQLVRALQASGEVVAMTGDGVNDAPALKAADIGVAMGKRGTAVARESADLVLLDDSFSALVQALAIGRRIDANLHRALGYTLAIHLPIAALSLLPLLMAGQPLILLPVHIALLHLVIDPASTVVFEALPASPALMRQPPRPPQAPLFATATWKRALAQGTLLSLGALALSFWPDISTESHRSLVFSYLLLVGGGLVWLSGDPPSWLTARGAAIGLGMWLLLLAIPADWKFLGTQPMSPEQIWLLLIVTLTALMLTYLLNRSSKPKKHG
jgi:Ca2+-transporting ATPase